MEGRRLVGFLHRFWSTYSGDAIVRVNLVVPFKDNAAVKRAGARWDAGRKLWYVENRENLTPFLRWIPKHLKQPSKSQASAKQLPDKSI